MPATISTIPARGEPGPDSLAPLEDQEPLSQRGPFPGPLLRPPPLPPRTSPSRRRGRFLTPRGLRPPPSRGLLGGARGLARGLGRAAGDPRPATAPPPPPSCNGLLPREPPPEGLREWRAGFCACQPSSATWGDAREMQGRYSGAAGGRCSGDAAVMQQGCTHTHTHAHTHTHTCSSPTPNSSPPDGRRPAARIAAAVLS
jgi:hypothetical protein